MSVVKRNNQSIFTLPLFICGVIALVYYFWYIFPDIFSYRYYEMVEGIGNLFRFVFVFIGLIFTDFVLSEKNSNNHVISTEETIIFQKTFKKSSWHTLYITFIMFVSYTLIFLGVIAINLISNPDLEINLFQSGDLSQEQVSGLVTPICRRAFLSRIYYFLLYFFFI